MYINVKFKDVQVYRNSLNFIILIYDFLEFVKLCFVEC